MRISKLNSEPSAGIARVASLPLWRRANIDLNSEPSAGIVRVKLYWSKILCWNPKKQIQEMVEMPFLLPHELVAKLFEHGDAN